MEVSEKIKKLRLEKGYTLKELSEMTELSQSFLSMVERGTTNLAITSLKKIADAFNIEMTYFFEQNEENSYFYVPESKQEAFWLQTTSNQFHRLSGKFTNRKLESLLVTLNPFQKKEQLHSHEGEEFYYVITGQVNFIIGDESFLVKEGETIHFPSSLHHEYENPFSEQATMICVMTPILFN